MATHAGAAL